MRRLILSSYDIVFLGHDTELQNVFFVDDFAFSRQIIDLLEVADGDLSHTAIAQQLSTLFI